MCIWGLCQSSGFHLVSALWVLILVLLVVVLIQIIRILGKLNRIVEHFEWVTDFRSGFDWVQKWWMNRKKR